MDLTPKQQASEAIRQAEAILIVTGQRPNIDQVSSVVALSLILRKFGKKVTAMVSDQVPNSASFITQGNIDKTLNGLRDFIMRIDLGKAEVDKLKYTIENNKLNIHVVPFKGGFTAQDVSFEHGDYHYDLIIAMGVSSRNKLDRVFEQNPELLKNTPLLNLDYHRINENYGAINLIDTNAATLSEMLISLAESLQTGLLDEPIATAMLTGIMASTDRFTAAHTTAKSMTVAAQLMAAGAKQPQIVKALFGSRERDGRDSRDRDRRPERTGQSTSSPTVLTRQSAAPDQSIMQSPTPQQAAETTTDETPLSAQQQSQSPTIDWNSVMPSVQTTAEPASPRSDNANEASDEAHSGDYATEAHLNPN